MRSPGRQQGWLALAAVSVTSTLAVVAMLAFAPAVHAQEEPPPADGVDGGQGAPARVNTPTANAVGETGFAISPDGRARLHLSLDTAVGFDTNPYSTPFVADAFSGDVVARIRPGMSLNYPGSLINFDGAAFVD